MQDIVIPASLLVLLAPIASSAIAAMLFMFRQMIAARDAQLADLRAERDGYRAIALSSVTVVEATVNRQRAAAGLDAFPIVPPVAPEHNSIPTESQQAAADLATLQARHTAAVLELVTKSTQSPDALPAGVPAS